MRSATALRLLVPFLAALATACDDAPSPLESLVPSEEVPGPEAAPSGHDLAALDQRLWADGFLWASLPNATSYVAPAHRAFNRTGRPITVTRPPATTGRHVVKFGGLSELLGTKSTVHVTGYWNDDTYCKPVSAYLVSSQVEVRCYKASTGEAVNGYFTALVLRKYPNLAFAYAHRPTETNYAPQGKGSWNPKGAIKVVRYAAGSYQVLFDGLGTLAASAGNGGHVQVSAVGIGRNHCKVAGWGGIPTLGISVECYNQAGVRTDSKFNVLFLLPSTHLAYAWADQPTASGYGYSPDTNYRSNPAGGAVTIVRYGAGEYGVFWTGLDPHILNGGNVQVTAYGSGNAQCKVLSWGLNLANVACYAPTGARVDSYFTVLLGS